MTLTGINTVSFGSTDPVNDGTIEYQWYEVGVGPVQEGDNASGTALQLHLFYKILCRHRTVVDSSILNPPTFLLLPQVQALTAPHNSDISTVTIFPFIEIIAQPSNTTTIPNRDGTFNIDVKSL